MIKFKNFTLVIFCVMTIFSSCKKVNNELPEKSFIEKQNDNDNYVFSKNQSTCVANLQNAGPDQIICPSPGSVQIGQPPELGITYQWFPTQGLSSANISNPIASPVNTTSYTLTSSGTNYIVNGDFELGNTLFSNDYIYYTNAFNCGYYFVGTNPRLYNSVWCRSDDHTPNGDKMLIIDGACCPLGSPPASVVWRQNISIPSGTYNFSYWVLPITNGNVLQLRVNGQYVGNSYATVPPFCRWTQVIVPITLVGSSNTLFELVNRSCIGSNDFAIDDLYLGCTIVQDEVIVEVCNPPSIAPTSYFQFGDCGPGTPSNSSIVPNLNNSYCFYWECGGQSHIFSSIQNNNNQWYINDILVTNGVTPSGSVTINPNGELIHGRSSGDNGPLFKFQVKNTTFGSQQLSQPTYVYYAGYIHPTLENIGTYKQNYTHIYSTPFNNQVGPNATYSWSVPGCTITDASIYDPEVQITFPPGISTSGITGTLTISNSLCQNGPRQVYFAYNPNL